MTTLSIIIPAYNERKTIRELLRKVRRAPLPKGVRKEIIVIDDGSTDGTRAILAKLDKKVFRVLLHKKNKGKGGAVKTGFRAAKGDILIIQDADLEYDPRDYAKLIRPIMQGKARVVYGSRRLNQHRLRSSGAAFYIGGMLVTWTTNLLYWTWLTDEPTCYKVFAADIIKGMRIDGDKFDWEPEVTAKVLKQGIRIMEIPIRYYPRHVQDGKKIRWTDGLDAIWTLVKYRFKG